MKCYKGFNRDMTCRGFQFKEGGTYTHDGEIKLCKGGFHACENPLDCLAYYAPNDSVYHEVELDGVSPERNDDSKVVGKTIKVGAHISFGKMVQIAIDYVNQHVDKAKEQYVTAGYCSVASSAGYRSVASSAGNSSVAEVSGKQSVAFAIGEESKVRGAKGCWIVCAEWGADGIKDVQCVLVDGDVIKADTWYTLKDGKFVEV